MWPGKIDKILEYYYNIQGNNAKGVPTIEQRKDLVKKMISAYESLSYGEKIDVLVPARWEFLSDRAIKADLVASNKYRYDISYNWPPNWGYVGTPQKITLTPEHEYDRIGSSQGRFLSPISENDGSICSFLERALPYYIPEKDISKSPAYHRYKVLPQYPIRTSSEYEAFQGEIAHAFWHNPDDGGGIQVELRKPIRRLGVLFNEIK